MRKIIFIFVILLSQVKLYSQGTIGYFSIKDSTTAFGTTLPNGRLILDVANKNLWEAGEKVLTTDSLQTITKTLIASDDGISKWEDSIINTPYNYGNLYNWYAVNTGKLAPIGWHVPTDAELDTLNSYLGGESIAGGKLKSTRDASVDPNPSWTDVNVATNETGFTALPAGARDTYGDSHGLNHSCSFWSSTSNNVTNAWFINMYYGDASSTKYSGNKGVGKSVRLIRDDLTGYVAGETVTDEDGNIYNTVQIGTQVWITQNLKTTKYNDGSAITLVSDRTAWGNLVTEGYCTYRNDTLSKYEDPTFYYTSTSATLIQPKYNKKVSYTKIDGLSNYITSIVSPLIHDSIQALKDSAISIATILGADSLSVVLGRGKSTSGHNINITTGDSIIYNAFKGIAASKVAIVNTSGAIDTASSFSYQTTLLNNTPTATNDIVATTGITSAMITRTVIIVQGSGGAVDITANPQIAAGTIGDIIELWGTSNTNTLKFDNGTGIILNSGGSFTMGAGDNIIFRYMNLGGTAAWYEISRSDNN